jgi:hypothetical protein
VPCTGAGSRAVATFTSSRLRQLWWRRLLLRRRRRRAAAPPLLPHPRPSQPWYCTHWADGRACPLRGECAFSHPPDEVVRATDCVRWLQGGDAACTTRRCSYRHNVALADAMAAAGERALVPCVEWNRGLCSAVDCPRLHSQNRSAPLSGHYAEVAAAARMPAFWRRAPSSGSPLRAPSSGSAGGGGGAYRAAEGVKAPAASGGVGYAPGAAGGGGSLRTGSWGSSAGEVAAAHPWSALPVAPAAAPAQPGAPRLVYVLWDANRVPFPAARAEEVPRAMAALRTLLVARRIMASADWPLRLHVYHSPSAAGAGLPPAVAGELERAEGAAVKSVAAGPAGGDAVMEECASLYRREIEVNRRVGMQIGAIVMLTAAMPVVAVASLAQPAGLSVVMVRWSVAEEDTACAAIDGLVTIPMPAVGTPPAAAALPVAPIAAPAVDAVPVAMALPVEAGGTAAGVAASSGGPRPEVCKHWLRPTGCRMGDACMFRHVRLPQSRQHAGVVAHRGGPTAGGVRDAAGGDGRNNGGDGDDSYWDLLPAADASGGAGGGGGGGGAWQGKPDPDVASGSGSGAAGGWGGAYGRPQEGPAGGWPYAPAPAAPAPAAAAPMAWYAAPGGPAAGAAAEEEDPVAPSQAQSWGSQV